TVIQCLRKFSPRDLAFWNQHQAAHSSARRVSGHRGGSIASGSAGHPAKSLLPGEGCGNGHARVLERTGGIQALMLAVQPLHTRTPRRAGEFVEWRISFAKANH